MVPNVGSEATLDVRLTVAGVRETIEVAPASFDVAKSQPSSLVTSDDINSLPEMGRNFLVLAQLLPGSGPLNTTPGRCNHEVRRCRRSAQRLYNDGVRQLPEDSIPSR